MVCNILMLEYVFLNLDYKLHIMHDVYDIPILGNPNFQKT